MMKTPLPATAPGTAEIASLAAELARAYQERVEAARDLLGLSPEEGDRHARGLGESPELTVAALARIRAQDPHRVSWGDLQVLTNSDPEAVLTAWDRIKTAARQELENGHRIAQAGAWQGSPWQRAQVLALREQLRGDAPTSGAGAIVVDLAAGDISQLLELSGELAMLTSTQAELERGDVEQTGRWHAPHQVTADLIAQVERRMEQAHRRVLRDLKMLAELRRASQTVYVAGPAQINVEQQQLNLAGPSSQADGPAANLPK